MTVAVGYEMPPTALLGAEYPRVAPPVPLRSRAAEFARLAARIGIDLMPWQRVAAQYLTAVGPDDRPAFREVAIVVARQNGKSTLLIPLILDALEHGRQVMHTAQNRVLPREVFEQVHELVSRHGQMRKARTANGQEHLTTRTGGSYRIVAPSGGGARGVPNDLVIVDELREMDDWGFIGAASPTLTASKSPQMVYLSNAGTEDSVVLNAIRSRADSDPRLAYLEWSAEPERKADDINGWAQANPALGHMPSLMESLEANYLSYKLAGRLSIFEIEHLCRWQDTIAPTYVAAEAWTRLHGALEEPRRPYMAISMAPSGERASAVLAWRQTTGHVGVRIAADVTGNPIDTESLGADLKKLAARLGVVSVAFDPWTDADLARRLQKTKPLAGRDYAVASENFARRVSDGSLRWDGVDVIATDLGWTTRKSHESGAYHAVRVSDEHSITAALAAVRAVWLATSETPPTPKVL